MIKEKEANINKTIQLINLAIDLSNIEFITIERLKNTKKIITSFFV